LGASEEGGDVPVGDVETQARWTQIKAASDEVESLEAEIGFEMLVDSMFSICCKTSKC
jgi:hypothetical protein